MPKAKTSLTVALALITAGILHAQSEEQILEGRGPHKDVFGIDIDDAECHSRDSAQELKDLLRDESLPYSFVGPPEQCQSFGCKHTFWSRRCRFEEGFLPVCTMEDRKTVVSWLADLARNGAKWAQDILTLKPCDLWPQIRGRTLWVVGDSVSQDMAFGISCFLIEYQSYQGEEISDNPATMQSLTRTLSGIEMTAWCFQMVDNSRICSLRANKAPRMANTILRLLPEISKPSDIVILNFGAWYNYIRNTMVDMEADMAQFEAAIREHREGLPKRLFWRESTAQHFDTLSGMFEANKSVADQRCAPPGARLGVKFELNKDGQLEVAKGSGEPVDRAELDVMLSGGHRNRITQPVVERLGLQTLPIWNISLIVHDVHKNYHAPDSGGLCVTVNCDCSHACSPSWYQMMLSDLNKALLGFQEPLTSTFQERSATVLSTGALLA